MKHLILAFLLIPALSQAAPVTLNLDNIKINELAKIVFSEINHANYIADDSFNRDESTATLRLQDQTPAQLSQAAIDLIQAKGYLVKKQSSVLVITKKPDDEKSEPDRIPFYYAPRYRDIGYITRISAPLFPPGRFTTQRAIASGSGSGSQGSTPGQSTPQDSGTSAYSQTTKDLDAFIFNGTEKETELLKKLLVQIDTPAGEILVKAFIYEVTNTRQDQTAFGAAVTLLNARLGIGTIPQDQTNSISIKSGGIEAVYTALAADSRFKIVSAPSLRVKDRENAKFTVGQEVPILGSVSYQGLGNQPVQSVNYKSSGIILDIYPIIRQDNIELQIMQQLSNFIPTTNGVNNSPTLIKRELSSVVNAQNDDIIVMGGLEETTANEGKSGFKWLPNFLKNNSSTDTKSDILLVLHVTRL